MNIEMSKLREIEELSKVYREAPKAPGATLVNSAEYRAFLEYVNSLAEQELRDVAALAWYGRGTEFGRLKEARSYADGYNPALAVYLTGMPLHIYLPKGKEKFANESLMPENLQETMSEQGLVDLVEYLMSLKKS